MTTENENSNEMLERIEKAIAELKLDIDVIPSDYYVPHQKKIHSIQYEIAMLKKHISKLVEKNYYTTIENKLASMLDGNHISWEDAEKVFIRRVRSRDDIPF